MIKVEEFTGSEQEWDGFAAAQDGYTHFHRLRWRELMRQVLKHECIYLAARDEEQRLVGILPLVRVKSIVFGHYLVSMPFLNYGGPLGSADAVRALVNESVELAREGKVKLLELRSRIPLDISLPASHRKITAILDLPSSSEALFSRFDSNLRRKVRKRQKIGVKVLFGPEQVEPFFDVFAHNMRDLGTPTQPLALFRAIAESFPQDCWFSCAYLDGRAVAGGCGFRFGSEFEMTWVSSLREYGREAPNLGLYWACMERAIDEGLTEFNFGRCSPGSGTHRFKMQWGAREVPLWWYGHASSPDVITPSPTEGAYRWGPRIWKRIPVSLATAVGPSIVRYIP